MYQRAAQEAGAVYNQRVAEALAHSMQSGELDVTGVVLNEVSSRALAQVAITCGHVTGGGRAHQREGGGQSGAGWDGAGVLAHRGLPSVCTACGGVAGLPVCQPTCIDWPCPRPCAPLSSHLLP